jgi:hypothetical protein
MEWLAMTDEITMAPWWLHDTIATKTRNVATVPVKRSPTRRVPRASVSPPRIETTTHAPIHQIPRAVVMTPNAKWTDGAGTASRLRWATAGVRPLQKRTTVATTHAKPTRIATMRRSVLPPDFLTRDIRPITVSTLHVQSMRIATPAQADNANPFPASPIATAPWPLSAPTMTTRVTPRGIAQAGRAASPAVTEWPAWTPNQWVSLSPPLPGTTTIDGWFHLGQNADRSRNANSVRQKRTWRKLGMKASS